MEINVHGIDAAVTLQLAMPKKASVKDFEAFIDPVGVQPRKKPSNRFPAVSEEAIKIKELHRAEQEVLRARLELERTGIVVPPTPLPTLSSMHLGYGQLEIGKRAAVEVFVKLPGSKTVTSEFIRVEITDRATTEKDREVFYWVARVYDKRNRANRSSRGFNAMTCVRLFPESFADATEAKSDVKPPKQRRQ